jgi:hypothetical protein
VKTRKKKNSVRPAPKLTFKPWTSRVRSADYCMVTLRAAVEKLRTVLGRHPLRISTDLTAKVRFDVVFSMTEYFEILNAHINHRIPITFDAIY